MILLTQGFCPMGCGRTLVWKDGKIVCSSGHCPRSTAVHDLLTDSEPEHIVEFPALSERVFIIRHPLRERVGDVFWACDLDEWLASLSGRPVPEPGRYRARHDGEWRFERLV